MPVLKPNKLAAIFVTVAVALALSSGDAIAQHRVTVTFVAPTLSQTIPWIAKEAGIFAKHGIDADVILLTGSPAVTACRRHRIYDCRRGRFARACMAPTRGMASSPSQQVLLRQNLLCNGYRT
jgi:hypothetical protein